MHALKTRTLLGFCLLLALLTLHTPHAQAGEPPTQPMLRIEAGMHTAMINRIATDAAGRFAVTASNDKTTRVWDTASGQLLHVLRPPMGTGDEGKLYAVALSPDGSTVAVAGWTKLGSDSGSTVYLFDRSSGQLQRRLSGLPNVILHLAFSPDGRWLAATLGDKGVRVWDWRQNAPALADSAYAAQSYGAHWSRSGQLATTSYDGKLRVYQVQASTLKKLAQTEAPGGKKPYSIAFAPDGRSLAVGYADSTRVDVLDAATLAWQFSPDTQGVENGNLGRVAWSSDGQTLVAAGRWDVDGRYPVRRWAQAGRGTAQDTPTVSSTVMHLAPLPRGGWLVAGADPAWGVLSASGNWQSRGAPPVADLRGSRGDAFLLGSDARQVQFGFEQWGKQPHWLDLRARKLSAGTLGKDTNPVSPRTTDLTIEGWIHTTTPTLNGQPLKLLTYETARSLAISLDASSFVLGAEWSLRLFARDGQQRWEQPVPSAVWGVNIPPSGQVVVAAYADGTIRWHRLRDGQELLAFFPHADRKRWVLWTPSGYYDASPGAEELIGWHVNRGQNQAADFFPASRFRSRFYRPDVIDRILDTLDEAEALKQADQVANRKPEAPVAVTQVLPPVVDVLSSAEISTASSTVAIKVQGRSAADAPVTGWRVRVNGQAVSDARGLGRQDGPGERSFSVNVPPQDSEIQIFAENRHGVSTPATVRVRWTGAAAQTVAALPAGGGFQIQPKLYVLAVGVAVYQHKDISPLGLPAKDASDFVSAMQRQKGKLYREVEVKLLTDGNATRDDVIDGLDWLQKQVTQHDVGMVFIAGHGTNDPTQGYTYLPVNADPDKLRRTGVAMDEFKKTLSALPGKALFFFDTCHAGNVLGARSRAVNDVSAVINELSSAENGVVVFSSSTGRQLSYEDPAWGNGAFTKALVEGINGAASYQNSGRITHKMLDLYISERVKELTKGKQSPVTQAPGGVPDYPVALK
ncbi:MAG: caspase family protein [Rhodoferax sp.]|nr:caspase family protein [Rhodoferax sp.]